MSAELTVVGNITEPELRYTSSNKEVLSFRIGATHRRKNQQTGQWEDVGEPLFLSVSLWEQDAQRWKNHLTKGTRVALNGSLTLRPWTDKDGKDRIGLDLVNVRVLGIWPKDSAPQTQQPAPYGQAATYEQPSDNPWATQEAPF